MGSREREARRHVEKIEYYHAHAGPMGRVQAESHYRGLQDLIRKAYHTKNGDNDVIMIRYLLESIEDKWNDMVAREKEMMASTDKKF